MACYALASESFGEEHSRPVVFVANAAEWSGNGSRTTTGETMMLTPGSLCDVAFRYARWLRETGQWEAMELFTWVIHPVIGTLAGREQTSLADLDRDLVQRSLRVAARDRIDSDLALGAWVDFMAFLDAEGIEHGPFLDGLA